MLRLLTVLSFFYLHLHSCTSNFNSCKQKIVDSKTITNTLSIPVNYNQRLIYSKVPPKSKILKYDPFLSLYLVEDLKGFKYPFKINMRKANEIALVSNSTIIEGKISKKQIGLNSLAIYSQKILSLGVITSICCKLEAIVTPRGIIEKDYLKRFISHESEDYSDIGIRVQNNNSYIKIASVNPYIDNNPFKKGDLILELNSKKIKSASVFMRLVLFSKLNSYQRVKIKRDDKILIFNVRTHKRFGGGDISDTFLEQKGIYFNQKLQIKKLQKDFTNYGLKIGDKLIQVNGKRVKNELELRAYIADYKDFSSLLLERDDFQFFVKIN